MVSQSRLGWWLGLGEDLDDVAVLQLVFERRDPAVDLRADTLVPDLGMDRE